MYKIHTFFSKISRFFHVLPNKLDILTKGSTVKFAIPWFKKVKPSWWSTMSWQRDNRKYINISFMESMVRNDGTKPKITKVITFSSVKSCHLTFGGPIILNHSHTSIISFAIIFTISLQVFTMRCDLGSTIHGPARGKL